MRRASTRTVVCSSCPATEETDRIIPPRWSLDRDDRLRCPACTHRRHLELVPEADPITGRVRT